MFCFSFCRNSVMFMNSIEFLRQLLPSDKFLRASHLHFRGHFTASLTANFPESWSLLIVLLLVTYLIPEQRTERTNQCSSFLHPSWKHISPLAVTLEKACHRIAARADRWCPANSHTAGCHDCSHLWIHPCFPHSTLLRTPALVSPFIFSCVSSLSWTHGLWEESACQWCVAWLLLWLVCWPVCAQSWTQWRSGVWGASFWKSVVSADSFLPLSQTYFWSKLPVV